MDKKPQGKKYRNLHARGNTIYFQRVIAGKRIRRTCKTDDWQEAAVFRDLYEADQGIGTGLAAFAAFAGPELPTLSEFAERYLDEDISHLAPTTKVDRRGRLKPGGPLLKHLGAFALDQITSAMIREWWNAAVVGAKRSEATGRSYITTLSSVYQYAQQLELVKESPVSKFRAKPRSKSGTNGARAAQDPSRHIRPIENPDDLRRLVVEAEAEGPDAYALVVLLLDSGLRLGEALALSWGQIIWGSGSEDPTRSLFIDRASSRGGPVGPPKSGRSRKVWLSKRLWRVLRQRYRDQWAPGSDVEVFADLSPSRFRRGPWRRIAKRAGLDDLKLKDLRDTFASQLFTECIPLPHISAQLGHSSMAGTLQNYARYMGPEEYRAPILLEPGEVPSDMLARVAAARGRQMKKDG